MPETKIEGEMLELAKHIIGTKKGSFDARMFDDRYEAAVAELVKAKIEGRSLPKRKAPPVSKSSDLLQSLRESAGIASPTKPKQPAANANGAGRQRKAAPTAAAKPRSSTGAPQRRAG
jgi:DNA end-binding protein Ku